MKIMTKNNLIILSGAPGSGKSTLLQALAKQNICCIPEFAREIIHEQRAIAGDGLYDKNPLLFKELMLSRAIDRYLQADPNKLTVFDRAIPDLLAYSDCFNLKRGAELRAAKQFRYHQTVFFTPSWEAIYTNDLDRCMSFDAAKTFGDNLKNIYTNLNYNLFELPFVTAKERATLILNELF